MVVLPASGCEMIAVRLFGDFTQKFSRHNSIVLLLSGGLEPPWEKMRDSTAKSGAYADNDTHAGGSVTAGGDRRSALHYMGLAPGQQNLRGIIPARVKNTCSLSRGPGSPHRRHHPVAPPPACLVHGLCRPGVPARQVVILGFCTGRSRC